MEEKKSEKLLALDPSEEAEFKKKVQQVKKKRQSVVRPSPAVCVMRGRND